MIIIRLERIEYILRKRINKITCLKDGFGILPDPSFLYLVIRKISILPYVVLGNDDAYINVIMNFFKIS